VLSTEENLVLTQVDAGTPMGDLLRRYWHPIAAVTELDERPIKRVRLLSEDLVLYKDTSGGFGLLDSRCPHRGADLAYGRVTECGLRCSYHGWLFDREGACIAQPFEEIVRPGGSFAKRIKTTAYPVGVAGGLLWAYLGPLPAPLVPNWEPFTWKNGFVQIVFSTIPCNWFQCQENSIDPLHFEWLHGPTLRGAGTQPTHLRVAFEEFEYGFLYRRIMEGQEETNPDWTIGKVCLWPNAFFPGRHFEWRVPVDDATTLSVVWHFDRVPNEREPFEQGSIPYWHASIKDPTTGEPITTHVINQDYAMWVAQGTRANRSREHLGNSDRGIIMMRKKMFEQIEVVARGGEPKAVIRDPERNAQGLTLPTVRRKHLLNGCARADLPAEYARRDFWLQAGQPRHVRSAYRRAMGFDDDAE
jgi:5,5'-dehydrodivanillate O-demethylase oxygenase subunit